MRLVQTIAGRAAVVLLLHASAAGAVLAPSGGGDRILPNYDARRSPEARRMAAVAATQGAAPGALLAGPSVAPGAARLAAVAALERRVGPIAVRWDDVTGSPAMFFAREGHLSGPDARDPEAVARAFVVTGRDLFGFSEEQARSLRLSAVVPTSGGGAVVHLAQHVAGLRVVHGHLSVSVGADGRVLHVMAGGVTGEREPARLVPQHQPSQAFFVAARTAGVALASPPVPAGARADGGATFHASEFRNAAIEVRPVVIHAAGGPRLAWATDLQVAGSSAWYEVVVDDATLQAVSRTTRTWSLETQGRVFKDSPLVSTYDFVRFPDSRDYVTDLSPAGWADESGASVVTAGNNAFVQDDLAGDDEMTSGRQATAGAPPPIRTFDFPFTGTPAADLDASLTSLFYAINYAHDRFHALGFNEASGNFQLDNGGLGGLGGDPVLGDAQDGSGTNNANFQTPPDGQPGRMQMFLWDISGSSKDCTFDIGVTLHEFTHGVSTRLVGGPHDVSCLFGAQGGSMGEGWSDTFAASFLDNPVIGAYVSGNLTRGIRMFRLDENPPAGKDYRSFCTFSNDMPPQFCEPHDNGEIWSGFLWRIREEYVRVHGAIGKALFEQLVVDGMKYTPCDPSMLDARDALVLADRHETGGQHACLIHEVARERWMGFSAMSAGGSDATPTPANDPWPECVDAGVVGFDRDGLETGAARATYSCSEAVGVVVTDGNADPASRPSVRLTTTGADSETLVLSPGAGRGSFIGRIFTRPGGPTPGNGTLEVTSGDRVTATYVDDLPAGATSMADADIACVPRLTILGHRIDAGTCDADAVPGYPQLPGFLDAGESADLVIRVANLMPTELEGNIVATTDRTDLVTVLPDVAFPVRFPAAVGSSPAETVITLKLVGADTIVAGDTANIELRFSGIGFPAGPPLVLPLELDQDYQVVPGQIPVFDMEAEMVPGVGPVWSSATTSGAGNQWTAVACANTSSGGRKAYRNGPANCMGRYSDMQGNPYLATPALSFGGPATRAARITRVEWQNDIDLGVTGAPMFGIPNAVDADAVAVRITNDPTQIDTSDPFALATESLAFYIKIDIPGVITLDPNTTGFVADGADVGPGQFDVDYLRPTFLAWYFLPDISFVQPPLDAQAEGYYLDDVLVRYERVDAVPQARACTADVTPFAVPVLAVPASGVPCDSDPFMIDASRSRAANCGPPSQLEYRFLLAGAPEGCYDDLALSVPRAQDGNGWGTGAVCCSVGREDLTYVVEVRCQAEPSVTDARVLVVPVLSGGASPKAIPAVFCVGSGRAIVLDASNSWVTGCKAQVFYSFRTGSPLAGVDCDGDTIVDDPSPSPYCTVGPSDVPMRFEVHAFCSAGPPCGDAGITIDIPAVSVTPVARVLTAPGPGGSYCAGVPVDLTGIDSVVTGCPGGTTEYRWSVGGVPLATWSTDPTAQVTPTGDTDLVLEVRCSFDTTSSCAPSTMVHLAVSTGIPVGALGTLRVTKTAGCPGPGDVVLSWSDSTLVPPAFVALRSDDPRFDLVNERLADVDGTSHADVGVACNGGGVPYRGPGGTGQPVPVYFYVVLARNTCTGDVIP